MGHWATENELIVCAQMDLDCKCLAHPFFSRREIVVLIHCYLPVCCRVASKANIKDGKSKP